MQRAPSRYSFENNKLTTSDLTSNHVVCRAVLPVSPLEHDTQLLGANTDFQCAYRRFWLNPRQVRPRICHNFVTVRTLSNVT